MIIKISILVMFCLLVLLIYSLCVAASNGDKIIEECRYNALKICNGKCCRMCELENICKLTCCNDPKNCGGRINI